MAAVPVTFIFEDGTTRTVDVPQGESILKAAKTAGYSLMVDCCEGRCGTCEAELLSGGVDLDAYDEMTLVPEDREAGVILSCVARAREPSVIQFPYDFAEVMAEDELPQAGRVVAVTPVAAETIRLDVEVAAPLDFLPGQYVHIGPAGADYTRSYSMANAPGEAILTFYVRVVPGGRFSQWISQQARPGDEMQVSAPRGAFFLREESRPRVFVAGGTGLAPFLSMLSLLAKTPAAVSAPIDILIGARSGAHVFALEQLERLASQIPGARIKIAVEEADERFSAGRVTDLLSDVSMDASTRAYLCGPPPMVDAARQAVTAAGVPRRDVLCERFS
jgi:benzoate/toluate 1,2-dioxygenase reductase subunit